MTIFILVISINYFNKLSIAKIYDFNPKPQILPLQFEAIIDLCLYSSLAYILEICTSITGVSIAAIASEIATEV